jgi:hypothetical protein
VHARSIQLLSVVFLALGVLILLTTLLHGGGPLSLGTLLGLAFLAVGALRLYLSGSFRGWRGPPPPPPPPNNRTRGQNAR